MKVLAETSTSPASQPFPYPGSRHILAGITSISLLSSQSTELHGTVTAACACAENVTVVGRNGHFLIMVLHGGISYGKLWAIPEWSIRAGKGHRSLGPQGWEGARKSPAQDVLCQVKPDTFPFLSETLLLTLCFFSQAEQFGSEDNSTVVIVPFGAWGKYKNGEMTFSFSRSFASSGRWA